MSGRNWIGAGVAGMVLLGAGLFFWPHQRRSIERTAPLVRQAPSPLGERPSPLAMGPVAASGPLPNEHVVPPTALVPAVVEQSPQSLALMIQGLGRQSPESMVRVLKVKHDGGCSHGTLVFALDEFRFECEGDARESFRIARSEVGKLHRNGVQVWKSGKRGRLGRRYHFSMVGRSRDLVEGAFGEWMRLR